MKRYLKVYILNIWKSLSKWHSDQPKLVGRDFNRYKICIVINWKYISGHALLKNNILEYILQRLNSSEFPEPSVEQSNNSEEEKFVKHYYVLLNKSSYLMWIFLSILNSDESEVLCPSEFAMLSVFSSLFNILYSNSLFLWFY